jgi:hypothetical protein
MKKMHQKTLTSDETVEKERRARGLERMVLRDGTTVREEDCNDGAVEIPAWLIDI